MQTKQPPFSPSSDAAQYAPVIIYDHQRKKNTVKFPPFSSDAAPYPPPVIIYDHPRNTVRQPPSSSDAAPYPPPVIILEHPRDGNMFSGKSCFMGGSYYNVRGNAHFSQSSQVPFGASPTDFNILT